MSTTPTVPPREAKTVTLTCKVEGENPSEVALTVTPKIAADTLRSLANQIDPPRPRRRTVRDGIETKSAAK